MSEEKTDIAVILHISEAIGLCKKCDKVVIVASLGKNTLETEVISAQATSVFDNNLVWETNQKSIKRMKTENLPVKIECFSVKERSDSETIRELIGFIIMPIRSIPFLGGRRTEKIIPRWHKLVGLSMIFKSEKPEILMCIAITSSSNINNAFALKNRIEQKDSSARTENMLHSQDGIYVQMIEDGSPHIQVGDGPDDCHMFMIVISIKCAKNLDALLKFMNSDVPNFHIRYRLFGNISEGQFLQSSAPNDDRTYLIQEKITIYFRSSPKFLKKYFQSIFFIPIEIYSNGVLIGNTHLHFDLSVLPATNLEEFTNNFADSKMTFKMEDQCLIHGKMESEISLQTSNIENEPHFSYEFLIQYIGPPVPQLLDNDEESSQMSDLQFILNAVASDKHISKEELPIISNGKPSKEDSPDPDFQVIVSNENISDRQSIDMKLIPRTYCYKLFIQKVQFSKKPSTGIWQMSLHHPKAHTPLSLLNIDVKKLPEFTDNIMENIEIILYFSESAENIEKLIESEPCVLNIKGPHGAFATAELDNEVLLAQKSNVGIILMENETGEKVAMAYASIDVQDIGANFNSQTKKFIRPVSSTNSYFDQNFAYKQVEELEQWKREQEAIFLADLKQRTQEHLRNLTGEWQTKRTEHENMLAQKLNQCNMLINALEDGHEALKANIVEEENRKKIFVETKAELEGVYCGKLLVLQERVRHFEEESEKQLKIAETRLKELESSHTNIQVENKRLKECINQLEQTTVSKEHQTDYLIIELKKNNEDLKKSKLFYKEQWAKMVREFNKRNLDKSGEDVGIDSAQSRDKNFELKSAENEYF